MPEPPSTPVTWRRRITGKHHQAGHLRTVERHPTDPTRFTAEVVATKTGAIRTLDSVAYEIHVAIGPGHGTPLDQWANTTPSLFATQEPTR